MIVIYGDVGVEDGDIFKDLFIVILFFKKSGDLILIEVL